VYGGTTTLIQALSPYLFTTQLFCQEFLYIYVTGQLNIEEKLPEKN
jgi:hypothetical protein